MLWGEAVHFGTLWRIPTKVKPSAAPREFFPASVKRGE